MEKNHHRWIKKFAGSYFLMLNDRVLLAEKLNNEWHLSTEISGKIHVDDIFPTLNDLKKCVVLCAKREWA